MSWDNYIDTVSAIMSAEAINDISNSYKSYKAAKERRGVRLDQAHRDEAAFNEYLKRIGCPASLHIESPTDCSATYMATDYKQQMERFISLGGDPSRITDLHDLKTAIDQAAFLNNKGMRSRVNEFGIIGLPSLREILKAEDEERKEREKEKAEETKAKLQFISRKQSKDLPESYFTLNLEKILGSDYRSFMGWKYALDRDYTNLDRRTRMVDALNAHYDPNSLDRAEREAVQDLIDYYSIPIEILHATEDDPDYDITAIDPDGTLEERHSARAKEEDRLEKLMDNICALCRAQSPEPPVPDNSRELKNALGSRYYDYLLLKDDFDKDRESIGIRNKIVNFLTDAADTAQQSGAEDNISEILSDLIEYYSLPIAYVNDYPEDETLDVNAVDINEILEQQIIERTAEIENKTSDQG